MSESNLGCVVIGRNEGDRLVACLHSLAKSGFPCVYVDSGSTDGSVTVAQAMGVHVIQLDMAEPFTAARARNVGWRALLDLAPNLAFVQFVDGDCVVVDGWLDQAHAFLRHNVTHAVVCGRRRERFPERSVYNRLCDMEWNTPVGDAKSCGGDALMRVVALKEAGGYRDDLIAGEEPELCVRLRKAGWRVHRLDAEMTLHDAAIFRFSQWWTRSKRAGHAFAEGAWLHGASPERHWVAQTWRAMAWGVFLPCGTLLLAALCSPHFLVLLVLYPLQVLRLSRLPGGRTQACFLVLGKFAEASGALHFYVRHLKGRQGRLIEYK